METPSANAWFANGERVGYDPKAGALVAAEHAPLRIFMSREGDPAQVVSFLPGFPDGSFGWAKVRPHLPNAAEMPKLFLDYVGMGDSDKPKDYRYSTTERTDLVERSGASSVCDRRRWSPSTSPRSSSWNTFDVASSARSGVNPRAARKYAAFSSSMAGSLRTGTRIRGTPRRPYAVCRSAPDEAWAGPSRSSRGCRGYARCGRQAIT